MKVNLMKLQAPLLVRKLRFAPSSRTYEIRNIVHKFRQSLIQARSSQTFYTHSIGVLISSQSATDLTRLSKSICQTDVDVTKTEHDIVLAGEL